ncbi:serine/threonine protein kinase [Blastomyces dermatitidis ER-3]|uniref:non-specific serine/threonine protein kinase n=1 Tax=Ajellomyces dermatitidis (strain ER-3 / ATCC MYA-2586) TaxID=559297 RepID=A0ABX2VUZ4_AJEDR|nr:serine/threonine protein kinase [Blastomyces dermatitidis ER-3]OAT00558.1 serine/threonine protein kinase [Blastomyces dermatitidis ER-3]
MLRLFPSKLRQAHGSSFLHLSRISNRNYLVPFRQSLSFQRSEELSCQTFPIPSDHESLPPLLYQWQEGVEDLENYFPVATHPTHIGDRYQNNRYEVVHKLGFGSYSTVWLAKNHDKSCFVALKIVVATVFEESREAKILTRLTLGKQNHPGRRSVLTLLDEFTITRPNGRHQCIVTEALGCSIANSKNETMPWKFPVNAARAIGVQVLLGLDYIHSCGVVHGDLHSGNILFRLPRHLRGTSDVYRELGEPMKLPPCSATRWEVDRPRNAPVLHPACANLCFVSRCQRRLRRDHCRFWRGLFTNRVTNATTYSSLTPPTGVSVR